MSRPAKLIQPGWARLVLLGCIASVRPAGCQPAASNDTSLIEQTLLIAIETGGGRTLQDNGEDLVANELPIRAMRWSPGGKSASLCIAGRLNNEYTLQLVSLEVESAEPIKDAQDHPVEAYSSFVSWAN